MAPVSRSMRTEGDYRSDQCVISDSIQRKAANFEVRAATGAASDIPNDRDAMLDRMVGAIGLGEDLRFEDPQLLGVAPVH